VYEHYLKPAPAPGPAAQQSGSNDQFALPDPVAFSVREFKSNAPELVAVCLIHGDRWRVEIRKIGIPGIRVCIYDGSRVVSSNPPPPDVKGPGPVNRVMMSSLNGIKPSASEFRDGRECWLFKGWLDPVGNRAELWVDQQTHLPVCISGWKNGTYTETHYQFLKSDFNILEKTCFDTSNTKPMLIPFLTP
jgi:hypothetical protein